MKKLNQTGSAVNVMIIALLAVALMAALGFGMWAFAGRNDYKNNSDAKAETVAAAAVKQAEAKKDAEYAEKDKSPLKTYLGPSAFGSISLQYPRTWSAYVSERADSNSIQVDGYFNVNFVQDISSKSPFALRVQVSSNKYEQELVSLEAQVKTNKGKISAYRLPKVDSILGVRFEGTVVTASQKQGTMIMLPLRDKTLKIWTEGGQNISDFNNNILPNLSFIP